MDAMDPKTARQVWQRVTAAPAPGLSPGDLHSLWIPAMETAALYRSLAASLSGKQKESALLLAMEQQETVFALRGMQQLSFGRGENKKADPPSRQTARQLLGACYRQARAALTEYTARTIHAEYGPVFRQLAAREEEHCLKILTLLGQL